MALSLIPVGSSLDWSIVVCSRAEFGLVVRVMIIRRVGTGATLCVSASILLVFDKALEKLEEWKCGSLRLLQELGQPIKEWLLLLK